MKRFVNEFIEGDSIKVMSKLPDESIGLVVTSPPYNIRRKNRKAYKGDMWGGSKLLHEGYEEFDDTMPEDEYIEWQRSVLREAFRVVRRDGAIFYNHKWRIQQGVLQDRAEIVEGFPLRQVIIWQRSGGFNFNPGYFLPTYEVIYLIAKPDFKLSEGANSLGDVWKINQDRNNPHPAPFPVELADRIISSTSADLVLDPFMGSGTTAIAAVKNKRDFIGINKSLKYNKLSEIRLENYRKYGNTHMFEEKNDLTLF